MAIVKNGSLTVGTGGVAQNLNLGFVPTHFSMWNKTLTAATPVAGIVFAQWFPQMANASAMIVTSTVTSGAMAWSLLASNGITPYRTVIGTEFVPLSGLPAAATNTNLTITAISKAANASITATHAFTSADIGVTTVTFHGIVGMTQMNTLSGVIQSVTSTTSFTVNVDSTSFSTYTSGGIANIISGVPAVTTTGFQVYNTPLVNVGFRGLTLGTSLMVNTSDVWIYEAVLDSAVTSD
jgi:hypothetical protein